MGLNCPTLGKSVNVSTWEAHGNLRDGWWMVEHCDQCGYTSWFPTNLPPCLPRFPLLVLFLCAGLITTFSFSPSTNLMAFSATSMLSLGAHDAIQCWEISGHPSWCLEATSCWVLGGCSWHCFWHRVPVGLGMESRSTDMFSPRSAI